MEREEELELEKQEQQETEQERVVVIVENEEEQEDRASVGDDVEATQQVRTIQLTAPIGRRDPSVASEATKATQVEEEDSEDDSDESEEEGEVASDGHGYRMFEDETGVATLMERLFRDPGISSDPYVRLVEGRADQAHETRRMELAEFEERQAEPLRRAKELGELAAAQRKPTYRNLLTYATTWERGSTEGKIDLQEKLVCNAYRTEHLSELVSEPPEVASMSEQRRRVFGAGFVSLDSDIAANWLQRIGHSVSSFGDFVFVFGGVHRGSLTNDLIVIDKKIGSVNRVRSVNELAEAVRVRALSRQRRRKTVGSPVPTTLASALTTTDVFSEKLEPPSKAFGGFTAIAIPPTNPHLRRNPRIASMSDATPLDLLIAKYDQPIATIIQYGGVTENDVCVEAAAVSIGEIRRRQTRDQRRTDLVLRKHEYVVIWNRVSHVPHGQMQGFVPVLRGNCVSACLERGLVVFQGGEATILDVVPEAPDPNTYFIRQTRQFVTGTVLGRLHDGRSIRWDQHLVVRSSPSPRAGASMCCVGRVFYFFGGHAADGTILSDLYRLDISRGYGFHWEKLDTYGMTLALTNAHLFEGTVRSVSFHAKQFQATSHLNLLAVGGYDGTIWHTTFFELDTSNYQWKIHVNGMGIGGVDEDDASEPESASAHASSTPTAAPEPQRPTEVAFIGSAFLQKKHLMVIGGTRERTSFPLLDYRRVVDSFTLQSAEIVNIHSLRCHVVNLFHSRKSHLKYAQHLEKWYRMSSKEICDVVFEIQSRRKIVSVWCNLIICETFPELAEYVKSGPYSQREVDEVTGEETGRYIVRLHLDPEVSSIGANLFRRILFFIYTNCFHFVLSKLKKRRVFRQIMSFALKFEIDPLLDLCHRRLDAACLLRSCVPSRLGLAIAPFLKPKPLHLWPVWRNDRFSNRNGMIEILCRVAQAGESILSPSATPIDFDGVFSSAFSEIEYAAEVREEYCDYIEEDETDGDLASIFVVHVHKGLICSRSEFFRSMFASSYLESRRNRIRFNEDEIGVQGIRVILSYMYTGLLSPLTPEECVSVYLCCHKLALDELFPYIRDTIKKNLDLDTVLPVLHISDIYFDPKIQKFACHFFCKNAMEVIGDEERKDMYENVLSAGARSAAETVMLQHYPRTLEQLFLALGRVKPKKKSGSFAGFS